MTQTSIECKAGFKCQHFAVSDLTCRLAPRAVEPCPGIAVAWWLWWDCSESELLPNHPPIVHTTASYPPDLDEPTKTGHLSSPFPLFLAVLWVQYIWPVQFRINPHLISELQAPIYWLQYWIALFKLCLQHSKGFLKHVILIFTEN